MVYIENIAIKGCSTGETSLYPTFRAKDLDIPSLHDGTFTKEDCISYGKDCAERILPYTMQDNYTRALDDLSIKSIVMENDYLKAVFLPTYGAKLMSLYSKTENRELLFKNEVMRPGNLANRNAWTSGGIEWNLGHRGHCAFTCDNMFAAKVKAPDGEEFVRFYEYEATHAQAFQLDFHLPDDAKQLSMFVRVFNARDIDSPIYWWTNTAVPLSDDTRVFSETDDILYQVKGGFGRCKMPYQPNMPGVDVSYPNRITRSVEYFFQNDKVKGYPWEVSVEGDGKGFFERSTLPLYARKMFCWGKTSGGERWCDYLSTEGDGSYLEIQAGLAPTQNHTAVLPAAGELCFTQIFGSYSAQNKDYTKEDWNEAKQTVSKEIEAILSGKAVQELHDEYYAKSDIAGYERIHSGTIYGSLENARCEKDGERKLPSHLDFATDNDKASESEYLGLLKGEALKNNGHMISYLTDVKWLPYFESVYKNDDKTAYYYAISLIENTQTDKGVEILKELSSKANSYASYALGLYYKREALAEQELSYFLLAFEQASEPKDKMYLEQLIPCLVSAQKYEKAWQIYESVTEQSVGEKARLALCKVAMELDNLEFAEKEMFYDYALVREGELALSDTYFEYAARKKAKEEGVKYTPDMIDVTIELPRKIDFRMFLLK